MTSKHTKFPTLFFLRQMQITTIVKCPTHSVHLKTAPRIDKNGEKLESSSFDDNYVNEHNFGKDLAVSVKSNTQLPYDPVVLLLCIYPRELII